MPDHDWPDAHWMLRRAQQLRNELVDTEMIMWSELRARRLLGYKFRRQHAVGPFILDFYCAEKRVAVEIDGPTHVVERDARRDRLLASAGITVVRIPNEDVYRSLDEVLSALVAGLSAQTSWDRIAGRTRVSRTKPHW